LLYEIYTEDYTGEISIGRSRECDWCLSAVDETASGKHAQITLRKGNFYLTDLGSRNGLYFQAKRISERKLAPGDRINLGECTVFVTEDSKPLKKLKQLNQLSYVNANGKKTNFDISKPETLIGSGPDCDLRIEDQLISSSHAMITLRNDGSCWIRDLGSRNGTSVNGKDLTEGSERMLQEGDNITLAYIEMQFLDAAVAHESSRLLTSIVIIGITVLVVLSGYIGYMQLTPSAAEIIAAARQEAARLNFAAAKKLLADSSLARNADDTISEREGLARQIAVWENTLYIWNMVKKDLIAGDFNLANSKLSSINHAELNTWNWNNDAAFSEKAKAQSVKKILDCCSSIDSLLIQENDLLGHLDKQKMNLAFAMRNGERYKNEEYMQVLLQEGKRQTIKLETAIREYQDLRRIVALLDSKKPEYKIIISRLEKMTEKAQNSIKIKAKRLLIPIRNLHRETERLLQMVDKVCNLEFDKVNQFKVELPDSVDYSIEKNIASLKHELLKSADQLRNSSIQIAILHKSLNDQGVICGKKVKNIEDFLDDDILRKIYSFDIFKFPPPRTSRRKPSGIYDEFLGYEFMYDYLKNIHTGMMTINMDDLPFKPRIYTAKMTFNEVDQFLIFVDRDENLWFHKGKLNEFISYCRTIPVLRRNIVKKCLANQFPQGDRRHVLALGMASFLDREPRGSSLDGSAVSDEFMKLTRNVQSLDRNFSRSMPEEQIKIRDDILSIGFPGDPIVKKMWRLRPTDGWSK
ncbi:MAG: FHA domain-containing protein, partial [Lentisphaeria bacterium]|nr:FHA domain-containing protein [Lentisphaeria bacterium]